MATISDQLRAQGRLPCSGKVIDLSSIYDDSPIAWQQYPPAGAPSWLAVARQQASPSGNHRLGILCALIALAERLGAQ